MRHVLYCTALVLGALFANSAQAAPYLTASEGTAATISLSVLGGTVGASGKVVSAAGSGKVYSDTTSLNINQSLSVGTPNVHVGPITFPPLLSVAETLSSGLTTSSASASTTLLSSGEPVSTTGSTNIVGANLALNTSLSGLSALGLSITADVINSASTAAIDPVTGHYFAAGSSTITNLAIGGSLLGANVLDANLLASLAINPTPNTTLLDVLGLKIVANEQISSITNHTHQNGASIETNALHIYLNNFLLNGVALTGDIILGHSFASVPEPESWALMILGFGLIGTGLRSKNRRQFALAA